MNNTFFADGTALVGGKTVAFSQRVIRGGYRMYVPASFLEDPNLVSNYTYLFSKDKSPLSIAIKYTGVTTREDAERQIAQYFNQATETLDSMTLKDGGVYYREAVTGGSLLSVYSLRFAYLLNGGVLFGCFNCSAAYKDDWRPVVLQMLQSIESV